MNGLKYNILVVDDDPLVLEDSVLMYNEMIRFGDFDNVFGKDAQGTVTAAKNSKEAEAALSKHFTKEPLQIEVLHVDERMPDERGSEFVDRMRRMYTHENIGALLVTGYATDVSVMNSREKGVYRYISKPVTPEIIKPHLADLVEMIFLKEKPKKRNVQGVFEFRLISKPEEILDLVKLRFLVWNKLGYIPLDRLSSQKTIEVDEYDAYSIPLGGFQAINGEEKLISTSRIILPDRQEFYANQFKKVIDKHGDKIVTNSFMRERKYPFIIHENYNGLIKNFLAKAGQNLQYVEYSRFMNNPDYRGMDLSIKTVQFLNMYSRFVLGLDVAFVECLVKHVDMNINKNHFSGIIPGAHIVNEERVKQIATALYVDLHRFDNPNADIYSSEVHAIRHKFQKDNYFCYCSKPDCIPQNYFYEHSQECPRNR